LSLAGEEDGFMAKQLAFDLDAHNHLKQGVA
jgi:hypothetical protein